MAESSEATDLDLYYLQRQGISGFSMTRVNIMKNTLADFPSILTMETMSVISSLLS